MLSVGEDINYISELWGRAVNYFDIFQMCQFCLKKQADFIAIIKSNELFVEQHFIAIEFRLASFTQTYDVY